MRGKDWICLLAFPHFSEESPSNSSRNSFILSVKVAEEKQPGSAVDARDGISSHFSLPAEIKTLPTSSCISSSNSNPTRQQPSSDLSIDTPNPGAHPAEPAAPAARNFLLPNICFYLQLFQKNLNSLSATIKAQPFRFFILKKLQNQKILHI